METIKPLPCPFCGSLKEVEIVQPAPYHAQVFVVYCNNCGAMGGGDYKQEGAVDCWNARAFESP